MSNILRLNQQNLSEVLQRLPGFSYNRQQVESGIMHLGIGNFHRAHLANYTDMILGEDNQWGIFGVQLVNMMPDFDRNFKEQDQLYTLMEMDNSQSSYKVIGAIVDFENIHNNQERVMQKLKSGDIKILSMTVTEKGYQQNNQGDLDLQNPLIAHDLQNIDQPLSTIGFIASGLFHSFNNNLPPYTVLSCDNLQENGDMVKKLVLQFSEQISNEFTSWIINNVSFPNSMVDRITPQTIQDNIQKLENEHKIRDNCLVNSETFIQWVIEDNFSQSRPNWQNCPNVIITNDVKSYELMKLRLLNAGHTATVYLASLLGYQKIDEAMEDPLIRNHTIQYMNSVTQCIPPVAINLDEYKNQLIDRFSNKALGDQVSRIAMDGFKKFQEFIAGSLNQLIRNNGDLKPAALSFAAWVKYLEGVDDNQNQITVNDPQENFLKQFLSQDIADVKGILSSVFSDKISQNFIEQVENCYNQLKTLGTREFLQNYY